MLEAIFHHANTAHRQSRAYPLKNCGLDQTDWRNKVELIGGDGDAGPGVNDKDKGRREKRCGETIVLRS
jgi:hypothetical protein